MKPKLSDLNYKTCRIQNTSNLILESLASLRNSDREVWKVPPSKASPVSTEVIVWILPPIKENCSWFISQLFHLHNFLFLGRIWLIFIRFRKKDFGRLWLILEDIWLIILLQWTKYQGKTSILGQWIWGMRLTEMTASAAEPPFISCAVLL